ncbi:formate dehydrogenase subunit beta [Ectothiorhodospira shaposhnikovii]|uniref:formate dehydrogenase subunit beta n=1 Tax=Ectothiorhodospira shaposhnikovii TaxID=1054 RepID=UPI001EE7DEF4|nr:formate dehydrogenase subunit beta [Ectothiorhodospira shaposhnikovii]MCG5514218.1 formate dehydrogenase subunit beta [Ectothiorhodospira shaposhnikovii]
MASMQSLDIKNRSATSLPSPSVRSHTELAKLIDVSKCIGCKACQVACMEWNDLRGPVGENTGVYDNPQDLNEHTWTLMRFSEVEPDDFSFEWLIRKDGCMHCDDPGCLKACPAPGAIVQYANGIVDFISEKCIGCGYCIAGCPFDIPRLSRADNRAYKCTLCSDRVAVGLEPACVTTCPTGCITFGTKEDMKQQAVLRIADLNSRGYDNAGLYDPPGVGGTHVMYVLQHADRPGLYHGLPEDPRISPMVGFWQGITKPLAIGALALLAMASFLHFIKHGPNVAEEDDDAPSRDKTRDRKEESSHVE